MSFWRSAAKARDALAQADAIGKSQAVIEFNMDGTIVTANENFLDAMGYKLSEIVGKRHAMFVEPGLRDSGEYRAFWADLNLGKYRSGEFKRIGKGGPRGLDSGFLQSDSGRRRQAGQSHQVRQRQRRRSAAWRMPARSQPSRARRR